MTFSRYSCVPIGTIFVLSLAIGLIAMWAHVPCTGTPHTLHYENARDALNAGKHVLCEKATTSNAAETKALIALAKERGLFFMEALWTRFHPLTLEVKKVAEESGLGDPVVLHADLSHYKALKSIRYDQTEQTDF